MSLSHPVRLGDVHSELSCILYAARQEFSDVGGMLGFRLSYDESTYLDLTIEFWGTAAEKKRIAEILVLRLQRGIMVGGYDYRFRSVSHNSWFTDEIEPHYVVANVDLCHWPHRRTSGFDGYKDALEWPPSAMGQPLGTVTRPAAGHA